MKKIAYVSILALGVLASAEASALQICSGTAGDGVLTGLSGTAGTNFIMTAFTPKCSNNVFLNAQDINGGAGVAVGSASRKGKTRFGGSTNGGGMTAGLACTQAGACTDTDSTTALSAAVTAAGWDKMSGAIEGVQPPST